MAPNRWLYPRPEWAYRQSSKLVRRLEHIQIERPPAEKAGEAIKKWIYECDATGIFVVTLILGIVIAASITACLWETIRYCRKKNSSKGWKRLQHERDEMRFTSNADQFAARSTPQSRPTHGRWSSLGGAETGLYDPPTRSMPPGLRPLAMSQPGHQLAGHRGPHHGRTMSDTLPQGARVHNCDIPTSLQPNAAPIPWLPPPPPAPFSVAPVLSRQQDPQTASSSPDLEVQRSLSLTITNPDSPTDTEVPISTIPGRTLSNATVTSENSASSSIVSDKPPTVDLKRTWTLNSWLPGDASRKNEAQTTVAKRDEAASEKIGETKADGH
ncbi:hypothetical protein OIV83_002378 [Microbotryomycetes sp. JL201]|nr:hypothetical protein OIV83_002378 [Microbotryomycetes sp. JL201]